ncbi:MAG: hypothetical protein GXO47_00365 [Chlorobi bacterium]|nr:hypothetical protein [Chlorobiota bacterium]
MGLLSVQKITVALLILFYSACYTGYGQDFYYVNGKVLLDNNNFNGVTVTLAGNGTTKKLPVSMAGMFYAGLEWNKTYYFIFKKQGYVSKIIKFITVIPDGQSRRIEPFSLNVRLFRTFEGVDSVFFRKPVAKIYFDTEIGDFTDDRDYSLKVLYAIRKMREKGDGASGVISKNIKIPVKTNQSKTEVLAVTSKKTEVTGKKKVQSEENTGIPPLKKYYENGRTVEEFDLDRKHVTRVIIKKDGVFRVYMRVEHNWGGVFYFIDETPLGYFSITENLFKNRTGLDPCSMHHYAGMKKK